MRTFKNIYEACSLPYYGLMASARAFGPWLCGKVADTDARDLRFDSRSRQHLQAPVRRGAGHSPPVSQGAGLHSHWRRTGTYVGNKKGRLYTQLRSAGAKLYP